MEVWLQCKRVASVPEQYKLARKTGPLATPYSDGVVRHVTEAPAFQVRYKAKVYIYS